MEITTLAQLEEQPVGTTVSIANTPTGRSQTWSVYNDRMMRNSNGYTLRMSMFNDAIQRGFVTATPNTAGTAAVQTPPRPFMLGDHVRLAEPYRLRGEHRDAWDAHAVVGHTGVIEHLDTFATGGVRGSVRWDSNRELTYIDFDCLTHQEEAAVEAGSRVYMVRRYYVHDRDADRDFNQEARRQDRIAPIGSVGTVSRLDEYQGSACAMVTWDHGGGSHRVNLNCLSLQPPGAVEEEAEAIETVVSEEQEVTALRGDLVALQERLNQFIQDQDLDEDEEGALRTIMRDHGMRPTGRMIDFEIGVSLTHAIAARDLNRAALREQINLPAGTPIEDVTGRVEVEYGHVIRWTEEYLGSSEDPCEDTDHVNSETMMRRLNEMGIHPDSVDIEDRECSHCS